MVLFGLLEGGQESPKRGSWGKTCPELRHDPLIGKLSETCWWQQSESVQPRLIFSRANLCLKENLLWGETTRVSWTFADVEVSCHRRLSSLSPPRPPPPPSLPSPPSPPWPPPRSHLGRRARRWQATGAWSSRPSLLLLLLCPPAGDWSKQTCRSSSCWKPRVAITGPLRSCFLRLPIYLALHTVLRITGQAGCFLSRHQLALPTSTSLRGSSFQKTQSSLDSWTHLSPIIHGIFRKSSLRIWLSVSRFITSFCVLFSFGLSSLFQNPLGPCW